MGFPISVRFFSLFLSSWFLRFYFCCVTYFLVSACPYMLNYFFPWKSFIFVRFNSSAVERFSTKSHLQQNKAKFSNARRSFEFLCFYFRFTFVATLDHSTDAWVSVWVKQKMENSHVPFYHFIRKRNRDKTPRLLQTQKQRSQALVFQNKKLGYSSCKQQPSFGVNP